MRYNNGYSILGFGCMRLPSNFEQAERLILRAIDGGINYFDTAYVYQGNEALLGKILEKNHCRDKIMIATKLPVYLVKTRQDIDKFFDTELERLRTDHVDNYLMHMLPDVSVWNRLKGLGIEKWIEDKLASGQIKHIGFSFHGSTDLFCQIVDAYDWDFCQIQYNYIDEHSQAGRRGLEYASGKGLDVIIMEPLRGGNLTDGLCKEAKDIFAQTGRSPASWALNWLYAQPEVTCVLSGMKTPEVLEENLADVENPITFGDAEREVIDRARRAVNSTAKISCTGCRYCMPCPHGVDIPGCFSCYNVSYGDGYVRGLRDYVMNTTLKAKKSNASLCVKCGRCEQRCPQHLPIRDNLQLVKKRFENPVYKVVRLVSKGMFKGE
ncbi:MAG: aldo/keto reductase [Oscillospiraceae bacterium]|nr:aldo/keto reductase [Oscillospiraceae bacterium]